MNIIEQLNLSFINFLEFQFSIKPEDTQQCALILNIDEQKQQFGDLNSSAALILAKKLGRSPRDIAQQIAQNFQHEALATIEIAGPGFLNLFLNEQTYRKIAEEIFNAPEGFFHPDPDSKTESYSIEFVSANPTGPLHFGHGRGGIIGDVLGNILAFLGNRVTKEFYINDAGAQIKKLGLSLKIRVLQALGEPVELPEDSYHGEYLKDLAQAYLVDFGEQSLEQPDHVFALYAEKELLYRIKETLKNYGIHFDSWFSERSLHESGQIAHALEKLDAAGHLYEREGALWFKSTDFGDDKDRVVRKASGELTYVAADIAYMQNKIDRGANHLVMILGHDHHSYVTRLHGLAQALGLGKYPFDIILYQLVKIKASGELVRMSKRAGNIVTLDDVIETVGKDVARFFYLYRKADAQLEFDIDLALKKTEENPVYYIQYAYVRTKSILDNAAKHEALQSISGKDCMHMGPEEHFLLKKIISLKTLLADIAQNHQTHLLAYYVHELAQAFAQYYSKHRVLDASSAQVSRARIALVTILRNTLGTILDLLEISKPERM